MSEPAPDRAQQLEQNHHFPLYKRYPITLVSGSGARVRDSRGKEYIDALSGIGVNSVGHCHPKVVDAIREQAGKLIHVSNLYYTEPQSELAKRLTEWAGMDRVFFTNSGTEAVEGAIKLARKRAHNAGRDGNIIAFEDCFHGRSTGPLSAGSEKQRKSFEPLLSSAFTRIPFLDLDALEEAMTGETVAVLLEPVQGEGGVQITGDRELRRIRELCDQHGALLILDEIQCGIGRTGKHFAFQHAGIQPDIVTVAKALGGGMPIGAVLASEEVARAFDYGDHGTTFGGNALACAAANAALEAMDEEGMVARAAELGERAMKRLTDAMKTYPQIVEVRGRGLMIGVELDFEGKDLVNKMLERGVLANCTANTVIRFLPPLNISREDLDTVIDTFLNLTGESAPEGGQA